MASAAVFMYPREGIVPLTTGYRLGYNCLTPLFDPSATGPTSTQLVYGSGWDYGGSYAPSATECTYTSLTSCYPGTLSGAIQYTFSPASQCPSGWASAAGATLGPDGSSSSASNFGTYQVVNNLLSPSESLILCCPTGWSYRPIDRSHVPSTFGGEIDFKTASELYGPCISYVTPSQTVSAIGAGNSIGICERTPTTFAQPSVTSTVTWRPLGLYFRPSPASTPPSQSVPITPGPTIPTANQPSGSSNSESNPGLSEGSKIAIGVMVPVAVLCGLAIGFLFWRRKKQARTLKSETQANGYEKPELDGHVREPDELDSQAVWAKGPVFELEEPYSQPVRQEMPS